MSNIPETVIRSTKIAENLCQVHGPGHIAQGRSGPVLYIACPSCLETCGKRELNSRHLAVVLEKCLSGNRRPVGYCMKDPGHSFTLSDLFSFPAIALRIPDYVPTYSGLCEVTEARHPLLKLESGIEVPYPPGTCTPLADLPKSHAAVQYLLSRGYSPKALTSQFGCEFCTNELPGTEENGIRYRGWECGFRDTPQNRIIFHAQVDGISRGWQARLLDAWIGDRYLILHPYTGEWTEVGVKSQELDYHAQYNTPRRKLSKYRNAIGMLSGNFLFGYDSFLSNNHHTPIAERVIVLSEGPLDAARFPLNGVAYTRAHVSPAQARLAASMASTVVLAYDNDKAGHECLERNTNTLVEHCTKVLTMSPAPYKDFGEAGKQFSAKALTKLLLSNT